MRTVYVDDNGRKSIVDLDRCECCADRSFGNRYFALFRTPGGKWFVSEDKHLCRIDEAGKYHTVDLPEAADFIIQAGEDLPLELAAAAGILDLDEGARWKESPPAKRPDADHGRFGWFVVRQSFTDDADESDDGAVMRAKDEAWANAVADAMTRRHGTAPEYMDERGYACWYVAEAAADEASAMARRLEVLENEEAPHGSEGRRDCESCLDIVARLTGPTVPPQRIGAGVDAPPDGTDAKPAADAKRLPVEKCAKLVSIVYLDASEGRNRRTMEDYAALVGMTRTALNKPAYDGFHQALAAAYTGNGLPSGCKAPDGTIEAFDDAA